MGSLKISQVIANAIEDKEKYQNQKPTKIILSKMVYDRLVNEVRAEHYNVPGKLESFMGYPIEVDHLRAIRIIVE